jgi:hypothetical protein
MDAVVHDAVEESLPLDALAHQAALHVRQGDDDRIDSPVTDHLAQLFELLAGAVLLAHLILHVLRRRPIRSGRANAPCAGIVARGGD